MSGPSSSSPAPMLDTLEQVRALLETSLKEKKHRDALAQALSLLAELKAGVVALSDAYERAREVAEQVEPLRSQLREVLKLSELQKADLDRLKATCEKLQPNQPERVPEDELAHAFKRVLQSCGDTLPANDAHALRAAVLRDEAEAGEASASEPEAKPREDEAEAKKRKRKKTKRRHRHGRRRLDLTNLPVETLELDPDEVLAAGGEGFRHIGDEISERIAFRPASYFRLRIVRRKWARVEAATSSLHANLAKADATAAVTPATTIPPERPAVLVAPLPGGVWPGVMADPSAIAQVIESKYDDSHPLHRQERISARQGFHLPRSTQCGWLGAAYDIGYRIVDAMFEEARAEAFCIATDATGAPVRPTDGGRCEGWHVFVFIADRDHILFRYTKEHSGAAVASMLQGFEGHLLADAAPIYDVLYRDYPITEVGCWFHARRYFWRALESDREGAMEALSLIAKLFEVDRDCRDVPMPARTQARAQAAKPVLALLDAWLERHRGVVDPRGPLDQAIRYYDNQRDALRRFLSDGRLRLDNNISEGALRNLVLGRHNWQWFANETGLRWYTTFRSLIASCALHGVNAQDYLEQMLRLAPHWPVTRLLELSPKYWQKTISSLDASSRALLLRPWQSAATKASVLHAKVAPSIDAAA